MNKLPDTPLDLFPFLFPYQTCSENENSLLFLRYSLSFKIFFLVLSPKYWPAARLALILKKISHFLL